MVQIHSGLPFAWSYGALAQLGEHLLCKQGVIGSIPIGSTSSFERLDPLGRWQLGSVAADMHKFQIGCG